MKNVDSYKLIRIIGYITNPSKRYNSGFAAGRIEQAVYKEKREGEV